MLAKQDIFSEDKIKPVFFNAIFRIAKYAKILEHAVLVRAHIY
jgi:hypothetical protein